MRNLGEAAAEFSNVLLKLSHKLGGLVEDLKGDSTKPYQINQEETENVRHALRYCGEASICLSKFVVPVAKTRTISTSDDKIFNRSLLIDRDQ